MLSWTRAEVLQVAKAEKVAYAAGSTGFPIDHLRDDAGENARAIIEQFRRQSDIYAAEAERRMREAVDKEAKRHTRNWTASVKAGSQIDIGKLLADDDLVAMLSIKSEEFVGLIKNLTDDMMFRINREVLGSILEGRSNADIAKALTNVETIGRNRARLIARDQASKLNGAMNAFRQQQAGVTHFRWKTIMDGRERASHHAKNGKVFAWDAPVEKPGDAVNCRCRALAVLIDSPEDVEGAGLGEAGDLGDPFDEANEPLIDTVSGTMAESVFTMNREALIIRQAEVRRAKEVVEQARQAAEFVEADAERLFERVFGFASEGQDLARMAGSNSLIAKRRALLFSAVKARFDTIEELVEHAAQTTPR
jgi:SPP1 gp7 family putative phage head morphogenesis protein